MSKQWLKTVLRTVAPRTTAAWVAARARARSHRLFKEWGLCDINRRLVAEIGTCVVGGPFRGTVLSPMTHAEHIGPYLLGSYEFELHPWWDELAGRSFPQIVDVGSKFGYYAVGLARRYPAARVAAFDIDPWARRAVGEMVAANRVTNLSVGSACTPAWLGRNLEPGALVVCDCEGYEAELFARPLAPALRAATLVVETHEHAAPGVTAALKTRFAETHAVTEVLPADHPPAPATGVRSLTPDELARASREVRGPQAWLVLRPVADPAPRVPALP